MMRIMVCLKPVPDPKHWSRLGLDPKTKTLIREGIPNIINPLDKKALEAALQLREKEGGEVITISMTPPSAISVLREGLAMGADRSILLSDLLFAGSDALATSYIMATAIKKLAPYDLILCGDQTLDGGTSLVSAQIAEFLDIPNLMHVSAIETQNNGVFHVQSQIEHGYMVVEIKPPVVLSVVRAINEPRYITFMNILEAERKEIQIWSSKNLSFNEPWVGLKGSPSQMADLLIPEVKRKVEILRGEPSEMARTLADRLHRLGYC
jgi:electron transfer flavoprotein beta subunit